MAALSTAEPTEVLMEGELAQDDRPRPIDISAIVRAVNRQLPDLARAVIRRHLDLADPANRHFLAEPDAREQHQTRWHQWGIITHSRVFLRHFDVDVERYLRTWGLWERTDAVLGAFIDGAPKRDLLRIAILLHDMGKFAARTRGRERFHFAHHEDLSGKIIRGELDLESLGLTDAQIEYIALTAEDHFVLGLVRKRAREHGTYDERYVEDPAFSALCEDVKVTHPNDFVEVGVLFLGDSLAKVDPIEGPPDAVGQYQINIEVARRYLETVLGVL